VKLIPIVWIESDLSPDTEQLICQLQGFEISVADEMSRLRAHLATLQDGAILIRCPLKDMDIAEVLASTRELAPDAPILVQEVSGNPAAMPPREALGGNSFCIFGASTAEALAGILRTLVESKSNESARVETAPPAVPKVAASKAAAPRESWQDFLIGESLAMQRVADVIRLVAPRKSAVLITGETGTGKEVVARALHVASGREARPFIAVNCSALPEALLEAELFGHAKGAFTGAVNHRVGRFEQAHQGTIFLDEIGDLPLELQGKLLRVLQEREFQRVGGTETIRVDTRVIAATNVRLLEAVEKKKFREDLFYRLKVVPIELPLLRQRSDDIPLLVDHFLAKLCQREGLARKTITPAGLHHLCRYEWPGNVRQLEHDVETAIVLSGERLVLEPADFPLGQAERSEAADPRIDLPQQGLDFEAMMTRIERYVLTQALEKSGGNKSRAAEMLGLKRSTLVSKVKALSEDGQVSGNSADW
jgi:DNA-binding NtrC family response regulator